MAKSRKECIGMLRKIISTILIMNMILGCTLVNATQENIDVNQFKTKFNAIGISTEKIPESGSISRGEFADIMVEFMNLSVAGHEDYTRFIDVDTSHKYVGAVNLLFDLGYVSGSGTYNYEPERNITYIEAASVIINIMGYRYASEASGGWQSGIYKTAQAIDLFDGVSYAMNSELDAQDLFKMLDNALDADITEVAFDGENVVTDSQNGIPALEKFHNTYVVKGTVTENQYTSFTEGKSALGRNVLCIGDEKFSTAQDFSDYIGYDVEGYYKNRDDNPTIVYIEKTEKNLTIDIDGDDITGADESKLTYVNENGSEKRAVLSNPKVIYNGSVYSGYGQISGIDFSDCHVRLLSNNADSEYEFIFITKYDNYYVSRIDEKNEMIYDDINSNSVSVGKDEYDVIIYDRTGKEIEINEIPKDCVVSVSESKNTNGKILKRVYTVSDTAQGIVSAYDDEDGYGIGDKFYKKSKEFTQSITLGEEVKLYLGKDGTIVVRTVLSESEMFGVLRQAWIDEENEELLHLIIFTQNGEFVEYDIEKRVSIDNASVSVDKNIITNHFPKGQEMLFKAENGKIKKIELPKPADAERGALRLLAKGEKMSVRGNNGINVLAGKVAASKADSKVLLIPTDTTKVGEYGLFNYDNIEDMRNKKYALYSFSDNKLDFADIVIMYDAAMAVLSDENSELFVVEKIYTGLNSDEEVATKLQLSGRNNISASYSVREPLDTTSAGYNQDIPVSMVRGVELSEIGKGDIIRIAKNGAGEITKIEKVYDFDDPDNSMSRLRPGAGLVDTAHYYADADNYKYVDMGRLIYSTLDAVTENFLQYESSIHSSVDEWKTWDDNDDKPKIPKMQTEVSTMNNDNIVVYDAEEGTSRAITRAEISNYIGKKFVMRINQCLMQEVIIYE